MSDNRREAAVLVAATRLANDEETIGAIAYALDAARADEAARWQAKIEALAAEWDTPPGVPITHDQMIRLDAVIRLRALLDGEQR